MRVSKKAVVILRPSLLCGLSVPAWSASSDYAASINTQMVHANPASNSLLGVLSSVLTGTDPAPDQPTQNCKASQIYSPHDVVEDPESCLMGH